MKTRTATIMGDPGYRNRYPSDQDGLERTRHLAARALQVFGNSTAAGVWTSRRVVIDGRSERPWNLAYESDAGLGTALAELDRIALDIRPDDPDPLAALRGSGARGQRR